MHAAAILTIPNANASAFARIPPHWLNTMGVLPIAGALASARPAPLLGSEDR
jgi:hypothetical protein